MKPTQQAHKDTAEAGQEYATIAVTSNSRAPGSTRLLAIESPETQSNQNWA